MKAIAYILKFRKLALCIACGATSLVIWAGLAHMGSPWVLVALVSLPALYHEASMKCQWNIGRCLEQMGKQVCHNSPDNGIPSNEAWDAAVFDIRKRGHLHSSLTATHYVSLNRIMLTYA